jgi:phosphatidylinositol alpha 1,6-mannosyltransferase
MKPRVALFAETYTEVNGAANVLRKLTAYAEAHDYPMLCIYGGNETVIEQKGSVTFIQLKRNKLSFALDSELRYDPFLWRHKRLIGKKLKEFQPEVLHVTGPNDVSQIGFWFGHWWKLPTIASWHTNAHEYGVRRMDGLLKLLPENPRNKVEKTLENIALAGLTKLLFMAQIQLAPNEELVEMLKRKTKRPAYLMSRGVDTEFLTPAKRTRKDDVFTIGYVGRLRPEKNIRFLAEVGKELEKRGLKNYKFLIVGDGSEEDWLKENLRNAEFTGVLKGEPLAEAYANMDFFAFPSKTDAFGNVVLEAMAAGVPSVVLPDNGPRFLIRENVNGFVAKNDEDFIKIAADFAENHEKLDEMKKAAREIALEYSWDKVFERVYEIYEIAKVTPKKVRVT